MTTNYSFANNTAGRTKKLSLVTVPTQFKTMMGNREVLVKGMHVGNSVEQYAIFVALRDGESCGNVGKTDVLGNPLVDGVFSPDYQVALCDWNREKYALPRIGVYAVDTIHKQASFIRWIPDEKKMPLVSVINSYEEWIDAKTQGVDVFDLLDGSVEANASSTPETKDAFAELDKLNESEAEEIEDDDIPFSVNG